MSYNNVPINHIVATDLNGCIGKDEQMPWHISADLKRFRELTTGGVVIMGRKTFDSLGNKPLPNRINIILTREWFDTKKSFESLNDGYMFSESIDDALTMATSLVIDGAANKVWIIGGAEIYAQTLQYVDAIYKTIVHTHVEDGDAFYPPIPEMESCLPTENFQDDKSGLLFHYRKLLRS